MTPLHTLIGVAAALVLAGPYLAFSVGARRYRQDVARRCAARAAGAPLPAPAVPARRPVEQMSPLRRHLIRNAEVACDRSAGRYERERVRARRGFSVVELAVVLIVVGVIAAIAIPTFQVVIQRASEQVELATMNHAMRNAVAIAAVNDRINPNASDIALAFDDVDPDAVVIAAGDSAPAPGVRTLTLVASADGTDVVEPSAVRAGECVVGTAESRTVTTRYVSPSGGGTLAAACTASAAPSAPDDGEDAAPTGYDCELVMPAANGDGTWAASSGWSTGSVSGCVPDVFVAAYGGAFGQFQKCPTFSTGTGTWVVGQTSGTVPEALGMSFPDHLTAGDASAGIGCVPTGPTTPEPSQVCPDNPSQTVTYGGWLAGEVCIASASPEDLLPVIGGPFRGGSTSISHADILDSPACADLWSAEGGTWTHVGSGASTTWVPAVGSGIGSGTFTLNAPDSPPAYQKQWWAAPGSWTYDLGGGCVYSFTVPSA